MEVFMSRLFLAVTILGLFLFGLIAVQPAQAQAVISKTLTAASQADLPCRTETYMAVGHKFTWTFSWINFHIPGVPGDADVFPAVVSSDMNVDVNNGYYGNGYREISGTNDSGYPSDYLQITQAGGSVPGRFTNMAFKVTYFAETPRSPNGP
jgi:hypothetical protein